MLTPPTPEIILLARSTTTVPMGIGTATQAGEIVEVPHQVLWMWTTTMRTTMIRTVRTMRANQETPILHGERRRARGFFVPATPPATSALLEASIWLATSESILASDPSNATVIEGSPDWTTCASMRRRCMSTKRSPPTHWRLRALDSSVRYEPIASALLVDHEQELQGVLVVTVEDTVETFQRLVWVRPLPIIVL